MWSLAWCAQVDWTYMVDEFQDPRVVLYFLVSNMALVVFALLGPTWCISALVMFAAFEIVAMHRRRTASVAVDSHR